MARTEVTGLQIKDGSVSLTADVVGILPVANGGTGSNTLALNNVLLGNGTGALQAVAPGASGNVLTSNGTTWSSSAASIGIGNLTGTTAQFNTALSDNNFATLAGTETLTNKTLTSPTLTSPTITGTPVAPFANTVGDTLPGKYLADVPSLFDPLSSTTLSGGAGLVGLHNELVFLAARGGSITVTHNGTDISGTVNPHLWFEDGGSVNLPADATTDTYVITISRPTVGGNYNHYWGMGQVGLNMRAGFTVRDVKFEVRVGETWTTFYDVTDKNAMFVHFARYSALTPPHAEGFRITLGRPVYILSSGVRIQNIWATSISGNSPVNSIMRYLPRSGGAMFGTAAAPPFLQAAGSDTNIDLDLRSKGSGVVEANGYPVATTTSAQTLTNKTISGASNTVTNLPASATPDAARRVCTTAYGGALAADGAGTWAKVCTITPSSNFSGVSLILGFAASAVTTGGTATVAVSVYRQGLNDPRNHIEMLSLTGTAAGFFATDSFKLIGNADGSIFELWIRKNNNYGIVSVYELSKAVSVIACSVVYSTTPAWQAATPVGAGSNFSTNGVSVFGIPVVTTTGTQTLTGKTLTSPTISSPRISDNYIKDSNGNTILGFSASASAVNYINLWNRAAAGAAPVVEAIGSDANISLNLRGKGTGIVQINGAEAVTASGTQTLTNKTLTSPVIEQINAASGGPGIKVYGGGAGGTFLGVSATPPGQPLYLSARSETDSNVSLYIQADGNGFINLNNDQGTGFRVSNVASTVNYVQATGAATGTAPALTATGTDASINLDLNPKGSGHVRITGVPVVTETRTQTLTNKTLTSPVITNPVLYTIRETGGTSWANYNSSVDMVYLQAINKAGLQIGGYTGAINGIRITGGATGSGPQIAVFGGDTNADLNLAGRGTGKVKVDGADVVTTSSAQALTNKTLTSPVITTPTGITKADVGLGNVDNTSTTTISQSLRANRNLNGGGTFTVDASGNVKWSNRMMVISNGKGTNFATAGYFSIECPVTGTVTGVGGAANKTATAAGIPLAAYEALYYILPIGSGNASVAANFRVAYYTGDLNIPHDWVLICVRSDSNVFTFNNGITLRPGESLNCVTQATAATINTLVRRDASGNFSAGTITATLSGHATSATSATYVTTGNADNAASTVNFRVMRNSNTTTLNDGMFIGYGNSNGGPTRLFGGGDTANPVTISAGGQLSASGNILSAGVTVPTISSTHTLTNKTIALGSNTVSGTLAQFNTALSDNDFATLAGTETLTNKTISGASNTITDLPASATPDAARRVVFTAPGGATAENGANTWAKLLTITPTTTQYSSCQYIFGVAAQYKNGTAGDDSAIISVHVSVNATGTNPTLRVEYMAKGGAGAVLVGDSFKLVSNGWNTPCELWVKKGASYAGLRMYELSFSGSSYLTAAYNNNAAWQSAEPTGSVSWASSGVSAFGVPIVTTTGAATLTNKTLTSPRLNQILDTNGAGSLVFTAIASGVNYTELRSGQTGGANQIRSIGSDTNIDMMLVPKGAGALRLYSGTTSPFSIYVDGPSATHSLSIFPKGAGTLNVNGNPVETTNNKAVANGYASLDSNGKVPGAQLPNSIMTYQGLHNASTNSPALTDAGGAAGQVYRISVAGTRNYGAGNVELAVGDYLIHNGTAWEKADTTDAVSTVAGKTGNVTLVKGDVGLGNVDNTSDATKNAATATLTNKTLTSPRINQINDTTSGLPAIVPTAAASSVNYVEIRGTLTGQQPQVRAQGTDTNIDLLLVGKGTGSAAVYAFTGNDAKLSVTAADANANLNLIPKGTGVVQANGIPVVTTTGTQTLTNKTLTTPRISQILDTSGNVALNFNLRASAVNYITVDEGATGAPPAIIASGSDADINLLLRPKGTGHVAITASNAVTVARFSGPATAANYWAFASGATGTGTGLTMTATGSDSNINVNLVPKGTGTVQANGVPVVTTTGTQALTNKTISGSSNTLSNISINSLSDAARLFNNSGSVHSTRTSFEAAGGPLAVDYGWRFYQGNTNGPGTNSAAQYYTVVAGLGDGYTTYAMQLAIPRNVTNPYLSIRYEEIGVLGAWQKISAGYADTAGSATTATSAATLTTARTIGGVSFNGSANINLPGVNTAGNQDTTGNAATATNATQVGGYSASTSATANTVAVRQANGYLFSTYYNNNHAATTRNSDTIFYTSTDDYIRKNTVAGAKTSLALNNVDNTSDATKWAATATLTNKTIALGSNTVSGTLAQFNTAVTDADLVSLAGTETLTNKRITHRVNTVASTATPSINSDTTDLFTITALAVAITGVTVTGTPTEGQRLMVRIKGTAARAIAWGASFVSSGVAILPTTTVTTKTHLVGFMYDSVAAKWVCVAADSAGY